MVVVMEMEMEVKVEGGGVRWWTRIEAKYLRWLQRAVDSELYIQQGSLKFCSSAAGNACFLACRQTDLQACCEWKLLM